MARERFGLQVTISQATHDNPPRAQDLLGHQIPPGDVAQVLDLALDALIRRLEARKFAATERPRAHRSRKEGRVIPADVRRAVWERDGGQCTFRSDTRHHCQARRGVGFDHVHEFSRGGEAAVSDIRLLCRAHNQYQAERTFGSEFMRRKREAARGRRASADEARLAARPRGDHDRALVPGRPAPVESTGDLPACKPCEAEQKLQLARVSPAHDGGEPVSVRDLADAGEG